MNEMTLSSRHRIRNSGPDGLRPSTLPSVGLHVDGEETFLFLSYRREAYTMYASLLFVTGSSATSFLKQLHDLMIYDLIHHNKIIIMKCDTRIQYMS